MVRGCSGRDLVASRPLFAKDTKVKNSGLRVSVEVLREDGTLAQQIVFDQRGLTYVQLLELQQKAITPCAEALMAIMATWGKEAAKKVEQVDTPTA